MIKNKHIKKGTFSSVWDGGTRIQTPCKVNLKTKEVYDIGISQGTGDMINELDYEEVIVDDISYPVTNIDDVDPETYEDYWYE